MREMLAGSSIGVSVAQQAEAVVSGGMHDCE